MPADCEPNLPVHAGAPAETSAIETSPVASSSAEDAASAACSSGEGLERHRLHQQIVLSKFGLEALQISDPEALLQVATELCAEGMRVRLCKALRYDKGEHLLRMCAGVGWRPGTVGAATVGADLESPAGYALRTGEPVISNHLENEERFRTPRIMVEHGVKRAINVLIQAHRKPWGVLEVDSPDEGRFEEEDIAFMQGFANLLGVAIERNSAEKKLREAVEYQSLLVKEASHRVKNSLAMVSSLLNLQARSGVSEETAAALCEAEARIATIAEAHDQLWRSTTAGDIDVRSFLLDLCSRLQQQSETVRIDAEAGELRLSAERGIALGLLVTELVTNAFKYAYPDSSGAVEVRLVPQDTSFVLEVRDDGPGLPPTFDLKQASRSSLGMRMVDSLVRQLRGALTIRSDGGAIFIMSAPR